MPRNRTEYRARYRGRSECHGTARSTVRDTVAGANATEYRGRVDLSRPRGYNPLSFPAIAPRGSEKGKAREVKSRKSQVSRATRETDITLSLDPDEAAAPQVRTGVPFFDHLLVSMAFHGRFALAIDARGDIEVDAHHLVEDTGIALGQALAGVFESTGQVARFGHAVVPMDEALAEVAIDVCGRPTLCWHATFPQPIVGTFDLSLLREFFAALAAQARMSLHIDARRGENSHHLAEAVFKALGRALRQAYSPSSDDMSSKGQIG